MHESIIWWIGSKYTDALICSYITYRYPQQPAIMFIVVSFFLVIAVLMPACVLCKNTTLAVHAYYTVLCSTITTLGYHHTSCTSTSAAKAPRFPSTVLHHRLLALWQLSKWHFMDFMQRISQTGKVTSSYFHCLHYTTLCFRKRIWRNLWNQSKIPLNSLK